jgi:L-alanine-DL-glutamate epimerase-like enolase superfamily enzyme
VRIADPSIKEHDDPKNGIRIEHGWIKVPTGTGLGIEIEPGRFGKPVASWG